MASVIKYLFIPLIAVIAIAIFLNFTSTKNETAKVVKSTSSGNVSIGGKFDLINQNNEKINEKSFPGKYQLVFFGFTNCPHICPSNLSNITSALNNLPKNKVEQIQPIFITVDPERDNVETMASYIKSFHPKFQALTGNKEDIAKTVKAYKVYSSKVKSPEYSEYLMDHSAYTYLMDPEGNYITHFNQNQSPEEIANKLKETIG